MNEETKKLYEISFLSRNEAGIAILIKQIKSAHGEIVHEGNIKEIELAYPIKNEKSAYFSFVKCNLPIESVDDISKALSFEDDILRFLVVIPLSNTERNGQEVRAEKQALQKRPTTQKPVKRDTKSRTDISNELLEEKLEEILK